MQGFRTIEEILESPIIERMKAVSNVDVTDRVLKSTRLEQQIFKELRSDNETLLPLEQDGSMKLKTFKSLVNDTFQSFYSVNPKYNDDEKLSTVARKLNKYILSDIMNGDEYSTLKSICEGRELPAMEATTEFVETLMPRLDELLAAASGKKESMNVLESFEHQRDEMLDNLSDMLEQRKFDGDISDLDNKIILLANKVESKSGQIEGLGKMVDRNLQKNKENLHEIIKTSVNAATQKAEQIKSVLAAWGSGSGEMTNNSVNSEILSRVKQSQKLLDIAKFLGRYKEMFCSMRKNSYSFGRGEKFDVEYGNNVTRALTSELSLLSSPELIPLFMRKYQNKQLKQYRKREAIYKGGGDIIVCLDESGSTRGEKASWGMATALVLLEICRVNKRNFTLIHFSNDILVDVFATNDTDIVEHIFSAAQTFLDGGTDYEPPLYEAVSIMEKKSMQNPDVVFITDGACDVSTDFEKWLLEKKSDLKFTIKGILLDSGQSFDFSLERFCDEIYKTSEMCQDEITKNLITKQL